MKRFFNIVFTAIQFTWGLIQTLIGSIGFLVTLPFRSETFNYNGARVVIVGKYWGGISFGKFIFLCSEMNEKDSIAHEFGHCMQSILLGPLFLIVIGLPSIVWASLGRKYWDQPGKSYYSFYTESWANKMGGVK